MHISRLVRISAVVAALVWLPVSAAEPGDGALLTFKVSSSALADAGSTNRASMESSVLVAYNEKFTMQARPFRVELTAAEEPSAANVKVTLFDARTEPPLFIGTQQITIPAGGGNVLEMKGSDGTAYAVSLQFKAARLPSGKS